MVPRSTVILRKVAIHHKVRLDILHSQRMANLNMVVHHLQEALQALHLVALTSHLGS
jgi:hypothetical protein